jgi:hypothetical protein
MTVLAISGMMITGVFFVVLVADHIAGQVGKRNKFLRVALFLLTYHLIFFVE